MRKKTIYMLIVPLLWMMFIFTPKQASAATSVATLVNDAYNSSKTLTTYSTIPGKATGRNDTTVLYNTSVKKYNSANLAVRKLSSAKRKTYITTLNKTLANIQIGKAYKEAVAGGKKIESKKILLDKYTNAGKADNNLLNAYVSLNNEVRAQIPLYNKVTGTQTRAKLNTLYFVPANQTINKISLAMSVKQAINEATKLNSQSAAFDKIASLYKTAMVNKNEIPQKNFKDQLHTEFNTLHASLNKKALTGTLASLVKLENQFSEIDRLISPGESNSKVSELNHSIKTAINTSIFTTSEKTLLTKRLNTIMSELNLSTVQLKELLTAKALQNGIPPEIVKGIAKTENSPQFKEDGGFFESSDHGIGIMQVTPYTETDTSYDWEKAKYSISDNIDIGIRILLEKWNYSTGINPSLPTINDHNKNILEDWYFAVMAYNGIASRNQPINVEAYQNKVYLFIYKWAGINFDFAFMNPTEIVMKPDPVTGDWSLKEKLFYSTTKETVSTQIYKAGDSFTFNDETKFRKVPTTTNNTATPFPKGTTVKIVESSIEDDNPANLYNWYKVQIKGQTGFWYVASVNFQ